MALELSPRLWALADWVEPGCRCLADIGTDHGYIPAALLLEGRVQRAVASDIAPAPLDRARATAERWGLTERMDLRLGNGLEVLAPGEADAVVSCLDSVNYVTRPAALRRTFARVYRALAPGGLFLFDVKTPSALEGADGQTYLDEDDGLFCVWRADYYPRRRVCGYGLDLFLRQEDGSWSRDGEYHEEYAYTMVELRGFLQDAGFQAVRLYGDKTMSAPKESAQRVFFAAKKER